MGHGAILQLRPHDRSWRRFDTVTACDRRTDGQTDGFTIANTALCIASYADALIKSFRLTQSLIYCRMKSHFIVRRLSEIPDFNRNLVGPN